jgi:diguanylate cyclase (GGDEF)-like protein
VGRSLLTGMMVLYAVLFFAKAPYNFLASVVPVLVLCWLAIRLLLKDGDKSFRTVSRVAAAILCLDIVVILYRTSLAVVGYGSQLTNAGNFNNPHLLYPILAEMLLNGFLVMTYMWFCVTEMQGALTRFAGTDALTGVLNRRALEAEAEREIARCARSGASLSLFAIDIDRFKKVNDTLGHRGGDRALVELVRVMKQELRLVDIVARIGGDEFVVLLPDATLAAAKNVAERLRIAVAQHKTPFDGGAIEMTISVGLAQLLPTDGSWQTVLDRADKALYQCKRAGRNSIAVDEGAIELLPDRVDHLQLRGNAGRVLWS